MLNSRQEKRVFAGVDWITVFIYLALVFMGWISIYAAVYDDTHSNIFDMSQKYGSQILWIGVTIVVAVSILLIDEIYYHYFSYPIYLLMIISLIAVLILGKEVNGAKSWFEIGSFRLQPAEFGKFATSLALAKYMSSYSFNIHRIENIFGACFIILLPAAIILVQNDTGSALVYAAFFIMLYREDFNKWFYIVGIMVLLLFIFSFLLNPTFLIISMLLVTIIGETINNGYPHLKIIYLAGITLLFIAIKLISEYIFSYSFESSIIPLFIAIFISIPLILIYAYRTQLRNIFLYCLFFVGALSFSLSVDYMFNNIMQVHQQKRILDLLGLETDVKGWGYNVNQSKIAIGSGGFSGKGFLQGTQTKFNFVPEQSTDFIFCTIGEEWGFMGSSLVVILFTILILRLFKMGDRQKDAFGRIYCYSVASIFIFHVIINIGMTIGLIPVIGIPLPFFSYGGSSLLAFTILLFVAIRINSGKLEKSQF